MVLHRQNRTRAKATRALDALNMGHRVGVLTATLFLAGLATFGYASKGQAATVDCSTAAAPAEFAICNSEDLQDLDHRLDQHFSKIISKATTRPVRQVFKREKDRFLIFRNQCGADMTCLKQKYEDALGKATTKV